MKFLSANEKNSFDPTPKLKSSPLPILFIPFNGESDYNCVYCGDKYAKTHKFGQRYCKKCLLCYINEVNDVNTYLDVTMKSECSQRELTPHNIQEIFYFEQIYCGHHWTRDDRMIDTCKLCGKLRCGERNSFGEVEIKPCSECYQISSDIMTRSPISERLVTILHLPCWYYYDSCIACHSKLESMSECEKACENCYTTYSGCRYCLTTCVIFGITDQSQCMKCKRVSFIDITKLISGNSEFDDFLYRMRKNIHTGLHHCIIRMIDNGNIPDIIDYIQEEYQTIQSAPLMKWIPYSQITNMERIAEGGFGIIHRATWDRTWKRETVIVKRLTTQNISKDFLNELKSNHSCYKLNHHIIRTFGFTKEPESEDGYMFVMEYASEGDLHKYLQRSFTQISWNKKYELQKLRILLQISDGLYTIHRSNFIHRDFHSGNILFNLTNNKRRDKQKLYIYQQQCKIGDLGLSQSASKASSSNEIYGVIPYVAPEIFNGVAFSKKSDIYCFGMIMWELTTGCRPFANVEYDHTLIYKIICGERPEITKDTPECFANLMKRCWDSDPKKRPTMKEIRDAFRGWCLKKEDSDQFDQAEEKRKELINLKELGPEFTEKLHPKASFTSRPLSSLISKALSINSSLSLGYITREYEFDINDINDKSNDKGYISKEFELDIESINKGYTSEKYKFDMNDMDVQSLTSQNLNSEIKNFLTAQHLEATYTNSPTDEFILCKEFEKLRI